MRRLTVALAALVAAVASTGCGDDDPAASKAASPASSTQTAKPLGKESAGSVVQFADCGDWRRGNHAERMATVAAIRGQLTPQRSRNAASPLPDDEAFTLLDDVCKNEALSSLRLYKLYVRMQGFAPLRD